MGLSIKYAQNNKLAIFNMSIYILGINHKTAPIALREKIYFAADKLALYLQDLLNTGLAQEAVLLSTCNRSELYCETNDIDAVSAWFCAQAGACEHALKSALYVHRDEYAVQHMMQVACGLDSMVLGEPQILGQLKEAFSESCTVGAVDALFHRLFQQIFSVAKDIRSTTAIGACPVSVASAAFHFVKQQRPLFQQANITLIGAGDMTMLLLRYLNPLMTKPIRLVNRRIENIAKFADEFGVGVFGMDELPAVLSDTDIVITATGSTTPIIDKPMLAMVMQSHRTSMLLVDIAMPRDIDAAVAELPNVELHCVDDLKAIIDTNRQGREHAAAKAREMVAKRSVAFMAELNSIDKVAHTIRAYRGQIEDICRAELNKAKLQLRQGANPEDVLGAFAYAFTQKLLHAPSVQLRQAGVEGRFELLRFAKQLFSIQDREIELL
jgi:glutamyl-tRNA reductase